MFKWLRRRKRRKLRSRPFPAAWHEILAHNAAFLTGLPSQLQHQVQCDIQVFVTEKNWEGCGGLVLSDEHRVTIAAQIARMTLGLKEEYFDEVLSILVYPDAYVAKSQDMVGSVVMEGESHRLGEAWYRGPVILAWNDVLATARGQSHGRNVVIHEFMHQLDMRNGRAADGIPTIENSVEAERWLQTISEGHHRLMRLCQAGQPLVLDCYGATSQAEFLAVAAEAFFEVPLELQTHWPELYAILSRYLNQSHAAR